MKIGRVKLLKSQIKKLEPVLKRADDFNKPPYDRHGFILIGQVRIPDNVNGLESPWLKVIMLTNERAEKVKKVILEEWEAENDNKRNKEKPG